MGIGCPEALLNALRARFDASGSPRNLGVLMAASAGDFKGRGEGAGGGASPLLARVPPEETHQERPPALSQAAEAARAPTGCVRAGVEVLAREGLVSRLVYGWTGSAPGFLRLVRSGAVQAWNLPLGVVSHIIRDVAARRPGPVTHVGAETAAVGCVLRAAAWCRHQLQ